METARRVRQRISAVFQFAIASGRAENDPAAVVKGALAPLVKGRQPAVETLEEARDLLQRVEAAAASPVTKLAHRFLALTAGRPGVINGLPWAEVDAAKDGVWRVPAVRMKLKADAKTDARADHLVPLSAQAKDVLSAIRALTGRSPYVFPNDRFAHRPMSENAMSFLLKREGFAGVHVPHGWRATFSTVMNERFPADRAVIDLMLAHVPANKVEGAYNRAAHLARRTALAQAWADMLLEGAAAASDLLQGPRR